MLLQTLRESYESMLASNRIEFVSPLSTTTVRTIGFKGIFGTVTVIPKTMTHKMTEDVVRRDDVGPRISTSASMYAPVPRK
jgi:hypothetical protein